MESSSAEETNFQNFLRACTAKKSAEIRKLKGKLKKLTAKLMEQRTYIDDLEEAVASQQQRDEEEEEALEKALASQLLRDEEEEEEEEEAEDA